MSECVASVCWMQLLADVDADLADVLAVRAQHDDLVPLQLRGEDEAIESVVLRFAVPDADERLLELLLDRREVVLHPLGGEAEVADAHGGAAPSGCTSYGTSASTLRPMFSSRGMISESGTGGPEWMILQWNCRSSLRWR